MRLSTKFGYTLLSMGGFFAIWFLLDALVARGPGSEAIFGFVLLAVAGYLLARRDPLVERVGFQAAFGTPDRFRLEPLGGGLSIAAIVYLTLFGILGAFPCNARTGWESLAFAALDAICLVSGLSLWIVTPAFRKQH